MSADPPVLFAVLAGDDHLASFHRNRVDAEDEAAINADEFGGDYRVVEYIPAAKGRVVELLHEALTDYATHASWRCEHPDRYPHEPRCPCDYTGWASATRAALAATTDAQEGTA